MTRINAIKFSMSCILILLIVCACYSDLGSSSTLTKINHQDHTTTMAVDFAIDGDNDLTNITGELQDLGWHLLNLRVVYTNGENLAIPVEGVIGGIYPQPIDSMGQQLELKDLNCAQAIFTKLGDNCNVYLRLKFNSNYGSANTITFPVQIAPRSSKISGLFEFTAITHPNQSIANYRMVLTQESQYYQGVKLLNDPKQYQILLIKNNSAQTINIDHLYLPKNSTFSIVERSTDLDHDLYYGNNSKCGITNNLNTKTINHLDQMEDSCLIIYQAAVNSISLNQNELFKFGTTTANRYFPVFGDSYKLTANYINGSLIPDQIINNLAGSYTSTLAFINYIFNYSFYSKSYPLTKLVHGPDNGTVYVNDDIDSQFQNKPVIVIGAERLNADTNIGGIKAQTTDGSTMVEQSQHGSAPESIKGDGDRSWVSGSDISVQLFAYKNLTQQNLIKAIVKANYKSIGDCHWGFNETYNLAMNSSKVILAGTGCDNCCFGGSNRGSSHYVAYLANSSCDNNNYCTMIFKVDAVVGYSKRNISGTTTMIVNFTKPSLLNVINFIPTPSFPVERIYYGGEELYLGFNNNLSKVIAERQLETNDNTQAQFRLKNFYSAGQVTNTMIYNLKLNQGQWAQGGIINFIRSGYDLNDFKMYMSIN